MGTAFSCTPVFSSTCLVWIILSGLIKGYLSAQDLWSWLQLTYPSRIILNSAYEGSFWLRSVRLGSWPSLILSPPLGKPNLRDILRGRQAVLLEISSHSCDPETLKTTIINNAPTFSIWNVYERRLRYHNTCLYRIEKNNMRMMKNLPKSLLGLMEQKKENNLQVIPFDSSLSSQCSCLLTRCK